MGASAPQSLPNGVGKVTGGGLVRRQMLRAATLAVLIALGTVLYQTVHRTDDASFLPGTWPISLATFQSAILSSELAAPRQERPTAALMYDASYTKEDNVLHQEDFADSEQSNGHLLVEGDVDLRVAILNTSSVTAPKSGVEVTSGVDESSPQPEIVVSSTEADQVEREDLGVIADATNISRLNDVNDGNEGDVFSSLTEKNETQGSVLDPVSLAQESATELSMLRANGAEEQVIEVAVGTDGRLENGTDAIGPDEKRGTLITSTNISVEQEITSREENVSFNVEQPAVAPVKAVSPASFLRPLWRGDVQAQLKAANVAIEDPSYVLEQNDPLHGPVYLNVTRFRRSYELMEKVFKMYVYKEGRRPLVHTGPLTGIYSSEGQFIDRITKGSRFVTQDPLKAHMFFLPYSVVNMVAGLYVPDSHSMLPLATFIKDYVYDLAEKYPYWNRTEGRDHFFVACHDWGPATARDHPTLRSNAVKVVCNADLTEEFVVEKDVSLPEVYLHKPRKGTKVYDMKLGGNGPAHRPYLAFFAGQMHGRVRPVLLQHWKDKDPDMKIYEVLPRALSKKIPYINHMKRSKFCICAAGYEVNSPRVVESIYYECVPVIIADNFVLPFSDVLDWSAFSITVAEKDIPNLKQILLGVSDERYRDLQGRLRYIKQHFLWHPNSPERYDAFHMIMHSVWMRRLKQLA